MLAVDAYPADRAVPTMTAGDAAWWPRKKVYWSGDVRGPSPQPSPAQPGLPQQVI